MDTSQPIGPKSPADQPGFARLTGAYWTEPPVCTALAHQWHAKGRRIPGAGRTGPRTAANPYLRPYTCADETAVLELVNSDRLTGQPAATARMLAEAIAGRSPVGTGAWAGLDQPRTDVLLGPAGYVIGAVSYSVRPGDDAGLILWLHCGEEETVAAALIEHALDRLGSRTVYAFALPSALGLGFPGLPLRHRPLTRRALVDHGFSERDPVRYVHHRLDRLEHLEHPHPSACLIVTADPCEDPPGRRLRLHDTDGALVGEAVLGTPVGGVGVLWRISGDSAPLGQGPDRTVLRRCMSELAAEGAREVIACLHDDQPSDAARQMDTLCRSAGFRKVDRLRTFIRRP
jgi:hypothetical protein